MHVPSLVKIPWHLLKLSSGKQKYGRVSGKIWRNLPISNPKPDLYNINAHTKFGENPLMFTQVIIRKLKYGRGSGRYNSVKIWWNLPISNPKPDLHNINAHTKFGEIHWCLLKLSSGNETRTDGRTDGQTHGHPTWNHNTPPLSCGGV